MKNLINIGLPALGLGLAILCVPAVRAQTFNFNVDLNTSGLSADTANEPFSLEFDLNQGSDTLSVDTVTLSNFQFTGGAPTGSSTLSGGATGDLAVNLAGGVSLTDASNSLNSYLQNFTPTTTDIKFSVAVSQNGAGLTPTLFETAIDDNGGELATTATDTTGLVELNLSTSNTLSDVGTYASTSPSPTGISATAIPEPTTTAAIYGFAAIALVGLARRFGQQQLA
jgi:hypothetical protein